MKVLKLCRGCDNFALARKLAFLDFCFCAIVTAVNKECWHCRVCAMKMTQKGQPCFVTHKNVKQRNHKCIFRPSATVSRIGRMESCTCRYCRYRGVPPSPLPPHHHPPPAWHENVMDGWGARPLRWLSVLVSECMSVMSQGGRRSTNSNWKKPTFSSFLGKTLPTLSHMKQTFPMVDALKITKTFFSWIGNWQRQRFSCWQKIRTFFAVCSWGIQPKKIVINSI